jgi:hypothetical protein
MEQTMKRTFPAALRILVCAVLFFVPLSLLGAESLSDVLPDLTHEQLDVLSQGTLLTSDTTTAGSLLYKPVWMPGGTAPPEEGFTVEALSLIKLPPQTASLSADELMIHILNTLRAVTTQEGITYISHRRGNTPHPLFTRSYHVERPGSRKELEDPVLEELPAKIEDIIFQRDTSFGGNFYQFSYAVHENMIYLNVKNLTTLAVFGIIPAVPKETLNIIFGISILEEGILCYSQAVIEDQEPSFTFLGFSVHLPSAFQRRITALQEWFSAHIS